MEKNIRNVVADRIKSCKLVVDCKAYPPKRPIGNSVYPRSKTGRDPFNMLNGGIVNNKWNVIKYKLIIKGVEINNRTEENQADNKKGSQVAPVLKGGIPCCSGGGF